MGNTRIGTFSVLKIFTSYPSFFYHFFFPFLKNILSAFFLLNFTKLYQRYKLYQKLCLRYSWHAFNFISSVFSQIPLTELICSKSSSSVKSILSTPTPQYLFLTRSAHSKQHFSLLLLSLCTVLKNNVTRKFHIPT